MIDSRDFEKNIKLPFVVRRRKIDGKMVFTGFVPGITKQDVVADDAEVCKTLLIENTTDIVRKMIKENLPFPFFPDEKELKEDFDDIYSITFAPIPNKK